MPSVFLPVLVLIMPVTGVVAGQTDASSPQKVSLQTIAPPRYSAVPGVHHLGRLGLPHIPGLEGRVALRSNVGGRPLVIVPQRIGGGLQINVEVPF